MSATALTVAIGRPSSRSDDGCSTSTCGAQPPSPSRVISNVPPSAPSQTATSVKPDLPSNFNSISQPDSQRSDASSDPRTDTRTRLAACPHIIEEIISQCDKATLFVCLLVNRDWHDMAGKYVYHSIVFCDDSVWKVLCGCIMNCDVQTAATVFSHLTHCKASKCGIIQLDNSVRNEMETLATTIMPAIPSETVVKESFAGLSPQVKRSISDIAYHFAHMLGSINDENTPYRTNFKAALLKHVRVLTIRSHNACFCDTWAPILGKLLPNVRVLRLAPACAPHYLLPLCDFAECPLPKCFNEEKVVFRNLHCRGLTLCPHYSSESVKEVALVFPTSGAAWYESLIRPPLSLAQRYPQARVKIIFQMYDSQGPRPPPRRVRSDES